MSTKGIELSRMPFTICFMLHTYRPSRARGRNSSLPLKQENYFSPACARGIFLPRVLANYFFCVCREIFLKRTREKIFPHKREESSTVREVTFFP